MAFNKDKVKKINHSYLPKANRLLLYQNVADLLICLQ